MYAFLSIHKREKIMEKSAKNLKKPVDKAILLWYYSQAVESPSRETEKNLDKASRK